MNGSFKATGRMGEPEFLKLIGSRADDMMKDVKERLRELLSNREKRYLAVNGRRRSAVLVPIYHRDGELYIVFTKRTEKMRDHKGQMSFPGGVYEQGDGSLVNTALREAEEEIGIKPGDVEVLGELDNETPFTTNYVISPFVGVIPWPYRFKVDAEEVDEVVEVPLTTLLDETCLRRETETVDGETVQAYFYHCLGVVVWGATARILNQLLGLLVQAIGEADIKQPRSSASREPGLNPPQR